MSTPIGGYFAQCDIEPSIEWLTGNGVVSIGNTALAARKVHEQITNIQAEPQPTRPAYPVQPQNTDVEQLAAIDEIRRFPPLNLYVNEPFQTQKDIENAIANANANAAYSAAVTQAEQGFKPYADSLAEWQAECDKVDAEYVNTLAEFATKQSERIAQLQSQINQLGA